MAAPENKTIKNLDGKWQINKTLSDAFEPVLALQGIGFLTRKAITTATVTLHIHQYEGPPTDALEPVDKATKVTRVDVDQTLTGGLKGTSESRVLDNKFRAHSDWLFGSVEGRSRWARGPAEVAQDFDDPFLVQGWADDADLIVSHVNNKDASGGWVAVQVWGFQKAKDGNNRYTRNIVVTKGAGSSKKRVAVRLIYDFVGERDQNNDDDGLEY